MSSLVLDAGALIAVERRDRPTLARLRSAVDAGAGLRTHSMIVAEVWRSGAGRQAGLARLLSGVEIIALDESVGRAAGELCGAAGTDDPIDAALTLIAEPGDRILTSVPADIEHLVAAAGRRSRVVAV